MPEIREFQPVSENLCLSAVVLSVDEYEAIRLIDKLWFSQEECGSYMEAVRTAVRTIYDSALKKIADALVNGLPLKI